jgi:hypothetical protein
MSDQPTEPDDPSDWVDRAAAGLARRFGLTPAEARRQVLQARVRDCWEVGPDGLRREVASPSIFDGRRRP